MKKFINNIKKYKGYMLYATKATERSCRFQTELALVDFGSISVYAGIYLCSRDCIWKIREIFSTFCFYRTESVELFQ